MTIVLTIIAFIVIFSVLVLIHELGHFIMARRAGIKVEEFGFGLPPKIWGKKKNGILYSINWIPFGGFVRLFGESTSEASSKDPRSFMSKPLRARIKVVIAGVFMNFLIALILLTFGFAYGMQPLIADENDVLTNVNEGNVQYSEGVIIKSVKSGSFAEIADIRPEDKILKVNDIELKDSLNFPDYLEGKVNEVFKLTIDRNGEIFDATIDNILGTSDVGLEIYSAMFFPRVQIYDVEKDSASYMSGLRSGDFIITMNDKEVYYVSDYLDHLNNEDKIDYQILRDNKILNLRVDFPFKDNVLIKNVFAGSAADLAGLKSGDIVGLINDKVIRSPLILGEVIQDNKLNGFSMVVMRNGSFATVNVPAFEDEFLGISMTSVKPYERNQMSVYDSEVITSLIKIEDVKYGLMAPVEALKETGRLTKMTAKMFWGVIKSFVFKFTIPEGVAGPIGIIQLTHIFVQEGLMALIRFMALLSLSLAAVNILPIPGLDGGRLFFLLGEGIIGKRLNPKWEAYIHTVGMVLLMLLIFAISYNDLVRIFS